MDIIIVGCGKVGTALADVLNDEHNVTIIDKKEALVEAASNDYDVMGIVGNCLQTEILAEANVDKCNIFIAVTASDEVNILSCLIAKKMGARHCIARVRSPEFDKQLVFMREELGISMMVNPDYNAANEIAKVLRYPEAINIESFAKGRVDLTEIRITSGSILDGVALSQLSRRMRLDVLICAVQRGDELTIPNGNFVLRAGDKIHMTASHSNMVKFFKSISAAYREKRVKSAVLIGGGRVAYHLAQQLIEMGVKVKIIEIDHERCLELSDRLNKVDISCADGTDHDISFSILLLEAEGNHQIAVLHRGEHVLSVDLGDQEHLGKQCVADGADEHDPNQERTKLRAEPDRFQAACDDIRGGFFRALFLLSRRDHRLSPAPAGRGCGALP